MVSTRTLTLLSTGLLCAGCRASHLTRPIFARQSNSTSGDNSTSSSSDLPDYMNPPNATGSFAIQGFDLSQPYDAAKSNETGWSIDIAVAANREVPNITDGNTRGNPTYLSLTSPENAFESADFDPGWKICGVFWDITDMNLQAKLLQDNGTCASVLSDECIDDLVNKTVNFSNDGGCPSLVVVDEKKCPNFGISNTVSRFSGQDAVTEDLADSINNDTSSAGSVRLSSMLYPYTHADNATDTADMYDFVIQKTWPSILTFYYDDGNGGQAAFPIMRCVRATELAASSEQPTPLEGAAAVPGVSTALAMAVGVAAVFVIWM